jgi:transcriptional regulator with XRE-family HTH domain
MNIPSEVSVLISDLSELGELIRRRRTELDLSQTELAERVGATRQWVSRLENGRNDISAQRLLAVIDALDLNLDVRAPRTVIPKETEAGTLVPASTLNAIAHLGDRTHFADQLYAALTPNLEHYWSNAGMSAALDGIRHDIADSSGVKESSRQFLAAATSKLDSAEVAKIAAGIVAKQLSSPQEEKPAIDPSIAENDDA